MKILWITNIPLPEASELLGIKSVPFGGWLVNSSKELSNTDDVSLHVAFPHREYKEFQGNTMKFFSFENKNKNTINRDLKKVFEEVRPDIVHIYGTEFPHTLFAVKLCKILDIKCIISIQGLVSVYAQHFYADIPINVRYGFTLRNILKSDSIFQQKNIFVKKGKLEIEALKSTRNVIGRTTWDRACVTQINPDVNYYFCNETLREIFYNNQWSYDNCEPYSIFLSQGQYPIKGLHYVLKALPIVLKKYPQAKVYVGGRDITGGSSKFEQLAISYYGLYIKYLIKKLKLKDHIIFLGSLNEKQMCEQYLKSNVFVCPSSIENSPNSLGEAMMLGVPCVASSTGGISDMIEHKKEGYIYQKDAPYMLAYYISKVFENEKKISLFSDNSISKAKKTHNKQKNNQELVNIYFEILKNKES